MSDAFGDYGRYYDLLYHDKDYAREAAYVLSTLSRFGGRVVDVLELGCGTGRHAQWLADQGIAVTGVERSETMLSESRHRGTLVSSSGGRFVATEGDARTFRSGDAFDAVVSLFHVVSYQTTHDDVAAMFDTVAIHLRLGGLFLFDVWYGPAVLSEKPSVRVKRFQNESIELVRIAEPRLDVNRNRVDVDYTLWVTDRKTGHVRRFTEHHPMRYYFATELELIAKNAGLQIVHLEEWESGAAPSTSTWGVTFIAQKPSSPTAAAANNEGPAS